MKNITLWITFTVVWLGMTWGIYAQHDNTSDKSTGIMLATWGVISTLWYLGDQYLED